MGQTVKESACDEGDLGQSMSQEDPLEKGMATHSSILAWRIPWTEEPGGLQSMWSQRVGHDRVTVHSHSPQQQQSIIQTNPDLVWRAHVLFARSCPTLCNHMDCSPPGSSVHGILQVRIPEWVAIPFSRGSS